MRCNSLCVFVQFVFFDINFPANSHTVAASSLFLGILIIICDSSGSLFIITCKLLVSISRDMPYVCARARARDRVYDTTHEMIFTIVWLMTIASRATETEIVPTMRKLINET